jgi:OOP family OmpA-OmpF porin
VLFETNKTDLLPGSSVELNKIVAQLKEKPSMKIEIHGHTDNIGDEAQNQLLSQGRAKAVYDYLLSKGIEKDRIAYKGFGSKKPVTKNDSENDRKKNRRVEMVIVKE